MRDWITIFTPTYNRGYILPQLYESLRKQTVKDFEWIVINDGSNDNTDALVSQWVQDEDSFSIRYYRRENGGKQRAINEAVKLAQYKAFFIVDSDDKLSDCAVEDVQRWMQEIEGQQDVAGVAGLRCSFDGKLQKGEPQFNGKSFIDATNLERKRLNIDSDMAEVFKTEVLKKYPFPVWHDETFTPECVVWDRMALDGYKIRWYNKAIYFCEYLQDGLTLGGYKLYTNNLMGCAMANNIKIESADTIMKKMQLLIEIVVACCLKNDFTYLKQCKYPMLSYLLLPIVYIYSFRRKALIKKYV